MSTEYYNSQWQMPNEVNKNKQANYSLASSATSNAINFDYTNEFMSGQDPWSLSLWILWTSTPVISKAYFFKGQTTTRSMVTLYGDQSVIKFMCQGDDFDIPTFTTPSSITVNKWYNLVITYDGNLTIKAYVDNTLDVTHTLGGVLDIGGGSNTNYFQLFQYSNLTTLAPTNVRLSNLSIFDYELSTSQITTLYGNSTNGLGNPMDLSPAPKAYYPLSNSVWNGSSYITPNNAVQDYVFDYTTTSNVSIGSAINLGKRNTQSLWIKKDAIADQYWFGDTTTSYTISSYATSGNNAGFFIRPATGGSQVLANNSDVITAMNNTDSNWVNWTFVRDTDTTMRIFADGIFLQSITGANWASYDTLNILQTTNFRIDGKLSNITLFDTNLSDAEVATLYNYGSPIKTLANIPQSSNLKAWYKLDASEIYNSSSTEWEVSDATAAIKLSTLQNAPGAYIENAYKVSDSSGVINFPSQASGTLKVSNSIWFYAPSSVSSGQHLQLMYAGPNSKIWLGFTTSNQLRAIINNGPWMYGNNVTMGQWNQFTATIDKVSSTATVKFYINGQPAGTASATVTAPINAPDGISVSAYGFGTYSGQVLSSNSVFWDNVILTDAEVLSHYNSFNVSNGVPTVQPTLSNFPQSSSISGWYKLDGNPKDSSGNSRDATYLSSNYVTIGPSVSNVNGQSTGMSRSNLIQSNLSRVFNNRTFAFHGGYINATGLSATTQSGLLNPSGSSFSLSIWFRNVSSSYGGILSKRDGSGSTTYPPTSFGMFKDDNSGSYSGISAYAQKLVFVFTEAVGSYDATNSIGSAETIQTNKWYNVVITHTPGNTKMYLNGSVDSTSNSITKSSFPDDYFTLSACFTNGLNWRGALSNLSFFDTVLSASEVKEIWNNGLPGNLNQHSKVDQLKDWIGIGSNYSGFTSGNTCLINYKKAPNMYGNIGALYSSTWNTINTTGFGDYTGTSSGFTIPSTTVTNIVANAPYSDKNAVSVNMWNQYSASQPNANITSGISDSTPQAT